MNPQFSDLPDGYKANESAPQIRFVRIRGRVIPIVNKKKSLKGADNINARLNEMKSEVTTASSEGMSFKKGSDGSVVYSKGFSNYPSFYRSLKFKNKSDFLKALEGRTKKSDDLVEQAHEDLSKGYDSSFAGPVPSDLNYKVDTKQVFDNRSVVFRKLNGQVRPIKIKKTKETPMLKNLTEYDDEVPF